MYGGGRLKVWHDRLGCAARRRQLGYRRRGGAELFHPLKLWHTGPIVIGVFHWYRAYEAFAAAKSEASSTEPQPAPPRRPSSAPLPPPPRLGDDPFRDPRRQAEAADLAVLPGSAHP